MTALLTPERVEDLFGYICYVKYLLFHRNVFARQPCSGKVWLYIIPIPSGVNREQSLNTHPCRARKGVDRVINLSGLRDVPYSCCLFGRPSPNDYQVKRPAAAVIPAPIAYIKVVAVKKLVVELWAWLICPPNRAHGFGRAFPPGEPDALQWASWGTRTFTLKKLECSKQAFARIH